MKAKSHPSWVCGLKHLLRLMICVQQVSHPSWVCGLKLTAIRHQGRPHNVTPFVGVWIET